MVELDRTNAEKRWESTAKPEKNSGELIVRENLTIKIRELMENWTTNPGLIPGNVQELIGLKDSEVDLDSDIPQIGDDITDFQERKDLLTQKLNKREKLKLKIKEDKAAKAEEEKIAKKAEELLKNSSNAGSEGQKGLEEPHSQ